MKEALKLALEALEAGDWYINQLEMIVYSVDDDGTHENRAKVQAAITAVKEALAQDEQISSQERVAIVINKGPKIRHYAKLTETGELLADGTNLYTTPPKRPWVGLTEEQREECTQSPFTEDNYDDIEAKLKELNT